MLDLVHKEIVKIEKDVKANYDLLNDNSFGLNCKCSLFVKPTSLTKFIKIIKICRSYKINYFILGCGTNVLVLNEGFSGVVICTKGLNRVNVYKNRIIAECGVSLFKLNDIAVKNSLSGLEFSYGIPGSVGGATYMNAGAFAHEMKDVIKSVTVFNGKKVKKYKNNQCGFEYRNSRFGENFEVILRTEFVLQKKDYNSIIELNKSYMKIRKATQPYSEKSAGSIFKRNNGCAVSKLFDDMNLKGESVGGAMVSTIHAGFIINKGKATSEDVAKLVGIISKKVAKTHQIDLQLEVKLLGDLDENFRRLSHTH